MNSVENNIQNSLNKNGFVELGIMNNYSDTLSLAQSIGSTLKIPNIDLVQTLTPKNVGSVSKNTYSGIHGLKKFPLHTDLAHWYIPPRYFILRCIEPDPNVFTLLLTKERALHGLSNLIIKRAIFKPRRKLNNKQVLLRILQKEVFRWDDTFIVPQNNEAHEIAFHIRNLKKSKHIMNFCFNAPNQALLIDNWKMLHGRSYVKQHSTRKIERIYLKEIKNECHTH